MEKTDFVSVTELSGTDVTREQVDRICHRYRWAADYCRGKDVVEVACGTGQGLGYLATLARSIAAGDISQPIVNKAREHYGDRIEIGCFNAADMPWGAATCDVVIIFEAIYYLPSFSEFLDECRRVLRPGGMVLIATANENLSDFNPSPYSQTYYGVVELDSLLTSKGFSADFFGHLSVLSVSIRQRVLRPIKQLVVKFGLMPKTMAGKKFLKRLVFGDLVRMPPEVTEAHIESYRPPKELDVVKDTEHKVIYCAATLM